MLSKIPVDSTTIWYISRESKGVVNLIFDSDSFRYSLINENDFAFSVNEQNINNKIEVPKGFELIGLESKIEKPIMNKQMKFLFIDTNNVACRPPS